MAAVFSTHRDVLLDVGTGAGATTMYGFLHSHAATLRGAEAVHEQEDAPPLPFLSTPRPPPPLRAPALSGAGAPPANPPPVPPQQRPPRRSPPPPPLQPPLSDAQVEGADPSLFASRANVIAASYSDMLLRGDVASALQRGRQQVGDGDVPAPVHQHGMQRLTSDAIRGRLVAAEILSRTEADFDAI
jgi:hypothetical protein